MHWDSVLAQTMALAKPDSLDRFQEKIPREWVEEALSRRGGTATMRRRRLPAEQVIWIVLGMALFRNRPIWDVVEKLDLALPVPRQATVAPSAIPQARARLGEEPMAWLFARSAADWAHRSADRHRWRGLALYGVDGSTIRVPDSEINREHFGGHGAGGERGESGYPMVRVVALMALRSHLLADIEFGPKKVPELTYARQLWDSLPENSLTLVDRGFLGAGTLIPLTARGGNRHWLTRAKKDTLWTVVENLGPGDDLVEIKVSRAARSKEPSLPKTWLVRAIRYQRNGFPPQILLTSLLDPIKYPATEVISLYHERWEIEIGYDEIKTELLEREETIRSKTPKGVAQELWGVFLAYNLIRVEMEQVADESAVEPTRISFTVAMRMIRDEMLWCAVASPGAIPKNLIRLRADLKRYILPPRRTERSYPRAVKIKMSNYERKRPKSKKTLN